MLLYSHFAKLDKMSCNSFNHVAVAACQEESSEGPVRKRAGNTTTTTSKQ